MGTTADEKKRDLRRPPDNHRFLYVVRFSRHLWPIVAPRLLAHDEDERLQCFYVGETGQAIQDRFAQHLRGRNTRQRLVEQARPLRAKGEKKRLPVKLARPMALVSEANNGEDLTAGVDIELVPALYAERPAVHRDEAPRAEGFLIDQLRAEGHVAWPEAPMTTTIAFRL